MITDRALDGRVAIVTGAGRGIGAATAALLAAQGARVVINYINSEESALEVLCKIEALGGQGVIVRADVRNRDDCDVLVAVALETFGRVDVLVSNASISFPVKPFLELEWDAFATKLHDEVFAAFTLCQAVVPAMIASGGGDIVLISSGMSRIPISGFSAHGTAKAALSTLGRYLAHELGPMGITTNMVSPGLVLSDATRRLPAEYHESIRGLTPTRRITMPEDVAGAVLGAVSQWNRQMNGAYIPVNGGIDIV